MAASEFAWAASSFDSAVVVAAAFVVEVGTVEGILGSWTYSNDPDCPS